VRIIAASWHPNFTTVLSFGKVKALCFLQILKRPKLAVAPNIFFSAKTISTKKPGPRFCRGPGCAVVKLSF